MLKSIFLLFICIILFSGCHRYHHNVRTVISPAIIFKPFHFKSRYHHDYRGNYKSYSNRHRGH
ncbi:hypothetical protein [Poseidonibacter ostreae]|uniref:Lipoprotein n=1 Tax=Poseidonibacter ostreae TaxID=2654171 RepID=A0A6L4WTZ9_9BACT|nr:hypothetical protein [Poseidonibacter ostreae]KAB7886028.1 hypothetical protein GA417_06665 [Poseidonibacter ostreae]KAB7889480.1 hypothetical protein GBG19_06100 [Poseidonibacter ostreae]KAB7892505.1 hypothetical protein GBG18_02455 [Poseidonibacter ostreae]